MSAPALRIAYFGTPGFAVPTLTALLRSRHDVVTLVSQPDKPKGRGHRLSATPTKDVAVRAGVPVLQPTKLREDTFLSSFADLRPDLGVVAAYGRILPDALLQIPRLGMINVHASLLPRYRGAAPVHRAVLAGDSTTGVTIMRVVPELDAGPMLATVERPIGPDDTSVEVERDLAELGAALLVDVVDRLAAGPVTETPQNDADATYAPKITKSESPIDWSHDAARIHNQVRGLQPWPLASASIGETRCLIHRTAVTGELTGDPAGTIVTASGDALTVAAGDGRTIRLAQIQPEGRRPMSAREFLNGRPLRPGDRLTST